MCFSGNMLMAAKPLSDCKQFRQDQLHDALKHPGTYRVYFLDSDKFSAKIFYTPETLLYWNVNLHFCIKNESADFRTA